MCGSSSYRLSGSGAKDARINAQSDANVEENVKQGPSGDVTADVRRRRRNGRRQGAAGIESFFQNASFSFEIGDVSEVAASRISSATTSEIERRRDAGERVKNVCTCRRCFDLRQQPLPPSGRDMDLF